MTGGGGATGSSGVEEYLHTPFQEVEVTGGAFRFRRVGDGPPLVFVHGVFVNSDLWRKVIPLLAGRFDCVALDLPLGSHTLPMSSSADLSPAALADLVGEAIDSLGLAPARIVANDSGGALTQLLMARHPELVHEVVLTSCDCYDNFFPPLFKPLPVLARTPGALTVLAQALRLGGVRRLPIAYGSVTRYPLEPAAVDSYVTPMRRDPAIRRDLAKSLRDVHPRHTLGAVEGLRRFPGRVLLAWGEHDRVFPLRYAHRLRRDLPHAELATLPEAGAFVPEDSPARLAQLIGDFFPDAA